MLTGSIEATNAYINKMPIHNLAGFAVSPDKLTGWLLPHIISKTRIIIPIMVTTVCDIEVL